MNQIDKSSLAMFKKAFNAAKRRSLKKKIPFEISVQDILDIGLVQDGRCFYSNIDMHIVKSSESLHDPYKMTVDCKDQELGYVKSNIVLCLYCVNSLKQKMSYGEMLSICQKIVANQNAEN